MVKHDLSIDGMLWWVLRGNAPVGAGGDEVNGLWPKAAAATGMRGHRRRWMVAPGNRGNGMNHRLKYHCFH